LSFGIKAFGVQNFSFGSSSTSTTGNDLESKASALAPHQQHQLWLNWTPKLQLWLLINLNFGSIGVQSFSFGSSLTSTLAQLESKASALAPH
jgi:hypothetical protein